MAESTAKLREDVLGLTNVNGEGGVDILADEETFRSTYDIMKDIAGVWGKMSDINRSALLEKLAGKVRSNQAAALLENFDQAEKALTTAQNAEGTMNRVHQKWMDSVEARKAQFEAAKETVSMTAMPASTLKDLYQAGTTGLGWLNTLMGNMFGTGVGSGSLGVGAGVMGVAAALRSGGGNIWSGIGLALNRHKGGRGQKGLIDAYNQAYWDDTNAATFKNRSGALESAEATYGKKANAYTRNLINQTDGTVDATKATSGLAASLKSLAKNAAGALVTFGAIELVSAGINAAWNWLDQNVVNRGAYLAQKEDASYAAYTEASKELTEATAQREEVRSRIDVLTTKQAAGTATAEDVGELALLKSQLRDLQHQAAVSERNQLSEARENFSDWEQELAEKSPYYWTEKYNKEWQDNNFVTPKTFFNKAGEVFSNALTGARNLFTGKNEIAPFWQEYEQISGDQQAIRNRAMEKVSIRNGKNYTESFESLYQQFTGFNDALAKRFENIDKVTDEDLGLMYMYASSVRDTIDSNIDNLNQVEAGYVENYFGDRTEYAKYLENRDKIDTVLYNRLAKAEEDVVNHMPQYMQLQSAGQAYESDKDAIRQAVNGALMLRLATTKPEDRQQETYDFLTQLFSKTDYKDAFESMTKLAANGEDAAEITKQLSTNFGGLDAVLNILGYSLSSVADIAVQSAKQIEQEQANNPAADLRKSTQERVDAVLTAQQHAAKIWKDSGFTGGVDTTSKDYAELMALDGGAYQAAIKRSNGGLFFDKDTFDKIALEKFGEQLADLTSDIATTQKKYAAAADKTIDQIKKKTETGDWDVNTFDEALSAMTGYANDLTNYRNMQAQINYGMSDYANWLSNKGGAESGDTFDELAEAINSIKTGKSTGKKGTREFAAAMQFMTGEKTPMSELSSKDWAYMNALSVVDKNGKPDTAARSRALADFQSDMVKAGILNKDGSVAIPGMTTGEMAKMFNKEYGTHFGADFMQGILMGLNDYIEDPNKKYDIEGMKDTPQAKAIEEAQNKLASAIDAWDKASAEDKDAALEAVTKAGEEYMTAVKQAGLFSEDPMAAAQAAADLQTDKDEKTFGDILSDLAANISSLVAFLKGEKEPEETPEEEKPEEPPAPEKEKEPEPEPPKEPEQTTPPEAPQQQTPAEPVQAAPQAAAPVEPAVGQPITIDVSGLTVQVTGSVHPDPDTVPVEGTVSPTASNVIAEGTVTAEGTVEPTASNVVVEGAVTAEGTVEPTSSNVAVEGTVTAEGTVEPSDSRVTVVGEVSPDKNTVPLSQNEVSTAQNTVPLSQSEVSTDQSTGPLSQSEVSTDQTTVPLSQTEVRTDQSTVPLSQSEVGTDQNTVPLSQSEVSTAQDTVPLSQNEVSTAQDTVPLDQAPVGVTPNTVPLDQSPVSVTPGTVPLSQAEVNTAQDTVPLNQSEVSTDQNTVPLDQTPVTTVPNTVPLSQTPVSLDQKSIGLDTDQIVVEPKSLGLDATEIHVDTTSLPVEFGGSGGSVGGAGDVAPVDYDISPEAAKEIADATQKALDNTSLADQVAAYDAQIAKYEAGETQFGKNYAKAMADVLKAGRARLTGESYTQESTMQQVADAMSEYDAAVAAGAVPGANDVFNRSLLETQYMRLQTEQMAKTNEALLKVLDGLQNGTASTEELTEATEKNIEATNENGDATAENSEATDKQTQATQEKQAPETPPEPVETGAQVGAEQKVVTEDEEDFEWFGENGAGAALQKLTDAVDANTNAVTDNSSVTSDSSQAQEEEKPSAGVKVPKQQAVGVGDLFMGMLRAALGLPEQEVVSTGGASEIADAVDKNTSELGDYAASNQETIQAGIKGGIQYANSLIDDIMNLGGMPNPKDYEAVQAISDKLSRGEQIETEDIGALNAAMNNLGTKLESMNGQPTTAKSLEQRLADFFAVFKAEPLPEELPETQQQAGGISTTPSATVEAKNVTVETPSYGFGATTDLSALKMEGQSLLSRIEDSSYAGGFKPNGWELSNAQYSAVQQAIGNLEKALSGDNISALSNAMETVSQILQGNIATPSSNLPAGAKLTANAGVSDVSFGAYQGTETKEPVTVPVEYEDPGDLDIPQPDPVTVPVNANTSSAQSAINSIGGGSVTVNVDANTASAEAAINSLGSNTIKLGAGQQAAGGEDYASNDTYLVDELGAELIEHRSRGTYELGTDQGARFTKLDAGDIVHNARETKKILRRGQAFGNGGVVVGGARASSNAPEYNGSSVSGGYTHTSTYDPDAAIAKAQAEAEAAAAAAEAALDSADHAAKNMLEWIKKVLDWIPIYLNVLKKKTTEFVGAADDAVHYLTQNKLLDSAVENIAEEIQANVSAVIRYRSFLKEIASRAKLSDDVIAMAQNGTIDLTAFSDERTVKAIQTYQQYWEKLVACQDALKSLNDQMEALSKQKLDNVVSYFDRIDGLLQDQQKRFESLIDLKKQYGQELTAQDYTDTLSTMEQILANAQNEEAAILQELEDQLGVGGDIVNAILNGGKEAWEAIAKHVKKGVDEGIEDLQTALESDLYIKTGTYYTGKNQSSKSSLTSKEIDTSARTGSGGSTTGTTIDLSNVPAQLQSSILKSMQMSTASMSAQNAIQQQKEASYQKYLSQTEETQEFPTVEISLVDVPVEPATEADMIAIAELLGLDVTSATEEALANMEAIKSLFTTTWDTPLAIGSDTWYSYMSTLENLRESIVSAKVDIGEMNDEIANIPLTNLKTGYNYLEEIRTNLEGINDLAGAQDRLRDPETYRSLISVGMKQIENLQEQNDLIEEQMSLLDPLSEKYQELRGDINDNLKTISSIRENQEEWNDAIIDLQIDRLKKQNDTYKEQLRLMQALDDLEKAKQRRILVYHEGTGFQYEADEDTLENAQEAANDAIYSSIVSGLERSKETSNVYGQLGERLVSDSGIVDRLGNLLVPVTDKLSGLNFEPYYQSIVDGAEQSGLLTSMLNTIDMAKLLEASVGGNVNIDISGMTLNEVNDVQELGDAIIQQLPNYLLQALYQKGA